MATSPNYGWLEPDNTDLVKNGALAIRTLGDAIDTTMATMTPKSIVDAKGDLIAASANDTPARLAVGANGETLVADSSTSTGLRYQGSTAAGRNTLINGGMDIWQRGTSGFTSAQYSADRWFITSSGGTLAGSRSTDVPTNPYFNYSYSMVGTSATNVQVYQRIESANSTSLAGRTVTLSVWAKNSAGTTALSYVALFPTAVDNWASSTVDSTANLTATSWSSSWTRYSVTFTVSASAVNGYGIIFFRNGTETSTTLLTGAQLELGSVPTNFSRAGATIQGETSACQRYYFRNTVDQVYGWIAIGGAQDANNGLILLQMPVSMRVTPTALEYGNVRVLDSAYAGTLTSLTLSTTECTKTTAKIAASGSGWTGGRPLYLGANNNAAAYVAVTAEL